MSQAFSYGNLFSGGPSTITVKNQFSVLVNSYRQFRRSVLISERAEKPLSQSAVDIRRH